MNANRPLVNWSVYYRYRHLPLRLQVTKRETKQAKWYSFFRLHILQAKIRTLFAVSFFELICKGKNGMYTDSFATAINIFTSEVLSECGLSVEDYNNMCWPVSAHPCRFRHRLNQPAHCINPLSPMPSTLVQIPPA